MVLSTEMDEEEYCEEVYYSVEYETAFCPDEQWEEVEFCAESGKICLHIAAERNNMSVADLLLSRSHNIEIKNIRGETPLMVAVIHQRKELVKKLIRRGANVEAEDENCDTPLLQAIHLCSNPIVDILLKRGASFAAENIFLQTPLHLAVNLGYNSIIDKLIEAGVDVNISNSRGETPIEMALKKGSLKVAEKLLAKGAFMCPYIVFRALVLCYIDNFEFLLNFVLKVGFDVKTRGNESSTLLHVGVMRQNEPGIRTLLERGADVNAKDSMGETPLIIASRLKNCSIVSLLLKQGACVNEMNNIGETSLYVAVQNWNVSTVCILLNSGADMTLSQDLSVNAMTLAFTQTRLPQSILSLILNAKKMELAKLRVNLSHNDKKINKHVTTLEEFEKSCVRELEHMKVKRFGRIPLYSIFKTCDNPVFSKNSEMENYIKSKNLRSDFPYYADLLKKKFIEGKKRTIILNELYPSFKDSNVIFTVLPYEIMRNILARLEYVELISLKKALIKSN